MAALALLWWGFKRRHPSAGWLGRIVWLAAGLIVAGPTLGVRVQVVDLTFGAAVLACLWAFEADRRWRWLVALPLLTLVWTNLHAGWPLVFLLGGAVIVGEAADRLLGRGSPLPWADLGRLGAALAASVPMIAINPNGVDLYLYPLRTSSIAAHRDFVSEWQPPDPGTFIGQAFIVFTVLFVLPALWIGLRRLRAADLLTMVGLTVMIALGARFLLVAPLIAATAGLALEPALAESGLGRRFRPILARLGTPRSRGPYSMINAVLVAVAVLAGLGGHLGARRAIGPGRHDRRQHAGRGRRLDHRERPGRSAVQHVLVGRLSRAARARRTRSTSTAAPTSTATLPSASSPMRSISDPTRRCSSTSTRSTTSCSARINCSPDGSKARVGARVRRRPR